MSTDLQVIVDDNSAPFSYSWSGGSTTSSPWILSTLSQWYRATSWYPSSATQTGTVTFTFNGTSAAFIGNTPASPLPQTATVQIDNGTSFGIDYDNPTPPTYKQWFITPTLPDGRHTIKISNFYGTAIDYAVVKVGNNTSLTGQTVVVDDDSSLIQYSGQWSRNTNKFIPGSLPSGYPFGNVTHRSSNPGDNFTFRFSGTSIAVYGIFSWYNTGSLAATYSIDGTPHPLSISVTTSSPNYLNKDGEFSNYLYFSLDGLPSGTHTLLVNITEANNQTFILDYITYKPSFDTLSSMPSLLPNSSSGATGSTRKSSATSIATSGSQQSVPTGTIVGGVLGGLAFGVLVAILAILLIRRRRRVRELNYAYEDETVGGSVNYPTNPYTPKSSQMQERLSPLRPHPVAGVVSPFNISDSQRHYSADVKHRPHERSHSATDPHSNTTPVHSSIAGNSTGVEESLADPPSYDAISNRVNRQP